MDSLEEYKNLTDEEKVDFLKTKPTRTSGRPMCEIYPKYIQRILQGESPTVSLSMYSGNGSLTEEEKTERLKEESERLERHQLLQSVRMPWWCPQCKKIMKRKIDEKFWNIRGKCFSCVTHEEHKIRLAGKWNQYEALLVTENKVSFLKDTKRQVIDYINVELKKQYQFVNENGKIDKWDNNTYTQTLTFLNSQLKEIDILLEDLEKYLVELREELNDGQK